MSRRSDMHASPRRGEPPTSDPGTGEVRVPLALYQLDEHQADIPLVLSRGEAERLHTALTRLLAHRPVAAGGAL